MWSFSRCFSPYPLPPNSSFPQSGCRGNQKSATSTLAFPVCAKRNTIPFLLSFLYVCPEPVLVNHCFQNHISKIYCSSTTIENEKKRFSLTFSVSAPPRGTSTTLRLNANPCVILGQVGFPPELQPAENSSLYSSFPMFVPSLSW